MKTKKTLVQTLGLCGIVSFLSYAAAVIFSPLAYTGYNWLAQAVSDLSAANAPSLALWNRLSALYSVCEVVCAIVVCIGIQSKKSKVLRVGVYTFAVMEWVSAVGYRMFPLSESGFSGTFQDIMHMVVTAVVVLLSIVSLVLIIIAGFRNKNYLSYGICAVIALSMMLVGALGIKIVPAEYFGVVERFSVFSATGFNMALGIHLFCANDETDKEKGEKMKTNIRIEKAEDYREVENVTREAFWNVYCPGCKEHYVLHCLRNDEAFVPELDFVLELNGKIIGQIVYAKSEIVGDDGRIVPIMTFGPISILPEYKRQGYGKQLLDYSIEQAKRIGVGAVAITGNIDFYGKSGFVPAKTKGIRYFDDPEADYFLIKEIIPNFLDGVTGTYKDPAIYFVCDSDPEAFERFDSLFPKKEKLKLAGQLF